MATEDYGQYAAAILCGGSSRRMGRPKLWLPWGRGLMIQSVVAQVSAAVPHVVLAAAAAQTIPKLPAGVEVVRDREPQRGPLEGLRSALRWASDRGLEAVFALGCDMPLLGPAVVRLTLSNLTDADAAVWSVAGKLQPLAAAYRVRVLEPLEELLDAGTRSLLALLDRLHCNILDEALLRDVDPNMESFRNVNTFAQYRELLERSSDEL